MPHSFLSISPLAAALALALTSTAVWADNSNGQSAARLESSSQILALANHQDAAESTRAASDEVYVGRQGNFDVSVMVDHQGQHKFSPEQEAERQAQMQQRHAQERATAQALSNPQAASQFVQSQSSVQTSQAAQTVETAGPTTNNTSGGNTNSTPTAQANADQASSYLDPAQDRWDTAEQIDMAVTKQTLQLAVLNSQTAPAPYTKLHIAFEHPSTLQESFILAGDKFVISFGEESGAFAITYTLKALSPEQQADFHDFKNLKTALTQRFQDKEHLLYGEYSFLEEMDLPTHKEVTLKAFLKKPADGILPEMQNYFYEKTVIDKGYIATLICEFRGSQAQSMFTAMRFDTLEPLCRQILQSYSYQFTTD